MTQKQDVDYATSLGIDSIGLIFYPQSKRYITLDKAQELVKNIKPFISTVAVLVDPDKAFVEEMIKRVFVHLLQFHGDESPEFCQQFNLPYIKAIQAGNSTSIYQAEKKFAAAQAILLDTPSQNSRGGTGQIFDWDIIPADLKKPYVLAGGLNPGNLSLALKIAKPYAVDVCSGVESCPGVKNHLKMKEFINVVRCINE